MVHLGIQEHIVNKYQLSHWEKERLVDLICSTCFADILPKYHLQKIETLTIDTFATKEAIMHDLPKAIEAFVAQYPRESSN